MAGKNIYIERMLAALETSMNAVSNGMAESVSILEQILANSGLERKNAAYTGSALTDLNPVYTPLVSADLGDDTTLSADDTKAIYQVSSVSEPNSTDSVTTIFIPKSIAQRLYSIKGYYKSTFAFNGYIRNKWVTNSAYPWPDTCVAFITADSNKTLQDVVYKVIGKTSADTHFTGNNVLPDNSNEMSLNFTTLSYQLNNFISSIPDDGFMCVRFLNEWNNYGSGIGVSFECSLILDNNTVTINAIKSGSVDDTGNIYTANGFGDLVFSIDLSGTAGELSDVKILAGLNESDSIDLLTAAGVLYDENVGLTIPLAEFSALAFKLRFNMSTGSTLSGINVRYY